MPVEAMKSSLFSRRSEVDEFEHDRGHIGEHVLERVAEPAKPLVAEIVGKAGERRQARP